MEISNIGFWMLLCIGTLLVLSVIYVVVVQQKKPPIVLLIFGVLCIGMGIFGETLLKGRSKHPDLTTNNKVTLQDEQKEQLANPALQKKTEDTSQDTLDTMGNVPNN